MTGVLSYISWRLFNLPGFASETDTSSRALTRSSSASSKWCNLNLACALLNQVLLLVGDNSRASLQYFKTRSGSTFSSFRRHAVIITNQHTISVFLQRYSKKGSHRDIDRYRYTQTGRQTDRTADTCSYTNRY